jgi:hypothetical protein
MIGCACSAVAIAAPSTRPASNPSTHSSGASLADRAAERAAEQKASAAVSAAVHDLLREYSAASSGSKSAKLRASSDYFTEHHSGEVTPKAIVAALGQSISDDPRAAAYVKWQLLSGLHGVEDAQVPRLLEIYRNAPAPVAQPGETQEERSKFELARRNSRKEDVPKLNEQLAEAQQERERENAPVLAFRDELFARLPEQNYDCLRAGFEDAYTRMKAGADAQGCLEPLIRRTRDWMISSSATQPQLAEMSRLVTTLSKENSPHFYSEADWDERTYKVVWRKKAYDLNKYGQMDKLARDLAEVARNGPSGVSGRLKYKDDSDNKKSKSSKTSKD